MAKSVFSSKVNWKGGVAFEVDARGFKVDIDEPRSLGGTDTAMNPVEMLLSALGGCLAISAIAFSKECDVKLEDVAVEVEGDLDADGFMGKNPDVRPGFSDIRYRLFLKTDAPQAKVDCLIRTIEARCPVSDTLKGVPVSGDYITET